MPEFDVHATIKVLAEAEFAVLRRICDSEECGVGFGESESEASDCVICEGRGWIPEPDVEKACWRIIDVIGPSEFILSWRTDGTVMCFLDTPHRAEGEAQTVKEAVLRAALAWAAEERGGE